MRHRYSSCVEMLLELLDHEHHQIAVSEMMKKLPTDTRHQLASCCYMRMSFCDLSFRERIQPVQL